MERSVDEALRSQQGPPSSSVDVEVRLEFEEEYEEVKMEMEEEEEVTSDLEEFGEVKEEVEEEEDDFDDFGIFPDDDMTQRKDDVKLKQMTPKVVLQRLPSEEREVEIPGRLEIQVIVPDCMEEEEEDEESYLADPLTSDPLAEESDDFGGHSSRTLRQLRPRRNQSFYSRSVDSDLNDPHYVHSGPEEDEMTTSDEDFDSDDAEDETVHRVKRSRRSFACPRARCSKTFSGASQLSRHIQSDHVSPKKAKTKKTKGPPRPRSAKKNKTKGPPRPRSAKKFKKRPESDDDFVSETREGKMKRTCDVCDRVFDTNEVCLRHQVKDHGVSLREIQCTHCDMTFLGPPTFKKHILSRHFLWSKDEGHLQCLLCLQFFQSKWSLSVHHNKRHSKAKGQQEEAEEGQSPPPDVLNIHCFVCKGSPRYSSAEELEKHAATSEHLETLRSKSFAHCNVCKMNFKESSEALQAHLTSPEHLKEAEALKDVDLLTFCVPCRKHFDLPKELPEHENRNITHSRVCAFRYNAEVTEEPPLEVPAQCPSCKRTYEFQSSLERHVLKFHDPSGYSCQFCPAKFPHLRDLRKHRAAHSDKIPKDAICDKCGKAFETRTLLAVHMNNVHSGKTKTRGALVVCDSCGKTFSERRQLDNHALNCKNAPDSSPCPHCTAAFKTLKRLRRHLYLLHHAEFLEHTPHSCPLCSLVYSSSADLTSHMTSAHRNMTCDTCGYRFLTLCELKKHQLRHTKEKPFECSICLTRFGIKDTLKNHVKNIHGKDTPMQDGVPTPVAVSCTSCGETFPARYALDQHALQCSAAPTSFPCAHCRASFKTPQRLSRHLYLMHYEEFLEEVPLSCPICYVIVPSAEELTPHMTSSHGNLTCDTCGKRFLSKNQLSIHLRSHTGGPRVFPCTLCHRKLKSEENLKAHVMWHEGTKPHQCKECDESFWRKNQLKKHVQETHG